MLPFCTVLATCSHYFNATSRSNCERKLAIECALSRARIEKKENKRMQLLSITITESGRTAFCTYRRGTQGKKEEEECTHKLSLVLTSIRAMAGGRHIWLVTVFSALTVLTAQSLQANNNKSSQKVAKRRRDKNKMGQIKSVAFAKVAAFWNNI